MAVTLRPATPGDLATLLHWDEQPHVIAAAPNDDWDWESELGYRPDWREHLIAERSGEPIGFVQIIDPAREESRYWGDVPDGLRALDLWIGEARDLGKGYGTAMMRLALTRCFDPPDVTAVLVDPLAANTRAHRFYERLGSASSSAAGSARTTASSTAWTAPITRRRCRDRATRSRT